MCLTCKVNMQYSACILDLFLAPKLYFWKKIDDVQALAEKERKFFSSGANTILFNAMMPIPIGPGKFRMHRMPLVSARREKGGMEGERQDGRY